jgi:hypothetical protein
MLSSKTSDASCRKGGTVSINGFAGKVCSVHVSDPLVRVEFQGYNGRAKERRSTSIKTSTGIFVAFWHC